METPETSRRADSASAARRAPTTFNAPSKPARPAKAATAKNGAQKNSASVVATTEPETSAVKAQATPRPNSPEPLLPSYSSRSNTPRPKTVIERGSSHDAPDGEGSRAPWWTEAPIELAADDYETIDAPRLSDVDSWGRSEKARQFIRNRFDFFYENWFRVEWEGFENIPREGGALLVSNHGGAIPPDASVIIHGIERDLGRPVYGLAENLFRSMPTFGTLWSRGGGLPAHPDNAYRILHDDQEFALVFPEGGKATGKLYKERYKLRRFGRGGFVELAMRSGVPIIPISVIGAEEAMPVIARSEKLAKMMNLPYVPLTMNVLVFGPILGWIGYFPSKFKIRVHPPIYFDVEPGLDRYPRGRVMEESDRIRDLIQESLYDMLRERRSVWFG